MKVTPSLFLSIVMLSLVVVCCIGQKSPELEGTLWKLDSYVNLQGNMVKVLPDTEITAQFKDGTVNGSSGCNSYFGSYTINGTVISFGPIGVTEMYCAEPEGIMEQENGYLAALQSVKGFTINGNKLEMINVEGTLVLVFIAV